MLLVSIGVEIQFVSAFLLVSLAQVILFVSIGVGKQFASTLLEVSFILFLFPDISFMFQVRVLCEKAKEILMEESNVQVCLFCHCFCGYYQLLFFMYLNPVLFTFCFSFSLSCFSISSFNLVYFRMAVWVVLETMIMTNLSLPPVSTVSAY